MELVAACSLPFFQRICKALDVFFNSKRKGLAAYGRFGVSFRISSLLT